MRNNYNWRGMADLLITSFRLIMCAMLNELVLLALVISLMFFTRAVSTITHLGLICHVYN